MKPHPETVILIEPATTKLWRVVERATTCVGVSPDSWEELQGNLPNYPEARKVFDQIKTSFRPR